MTTVSMKPYLFFGGRCDEAIEFYRQALAKVEMLMRYKESPEAPPPGVLQAGFAEKVMHATLNVGGWTCQLVRSTREPGKTPSGATAPRTRSGKTAFTLPENIRLTNNEPR